MRKMKTQKYIKFGHFVAKNRLLILIIGVVLLIPSIFGFIGTRINYDLLTYLPEELESTQGQKILDETFHNAATSMLIIENTEASDILKLKEKISSVDGVDSVIWRDDMLDVTVPKMMLPDELKDAFYNEDNTILFIKFLNSASSDETMNAIDEIRAIAKKESWLSGISALVKDTKELISTETPIYIGIAVLLSFIVLCLTTESILIAILFLVNILFAVLYNMGSNYFLGEISYLTKSIAAVLQLAVTMDYSIFLYHRYDEERNKFEDHVDSMASAISQTISAIAGSSLTTIAGFLALLAMQLTLGKDIGIVMAKGIIFGLITAVTILPGLILLFEKPLQRFKHRILLPKFGSTAAFVTKHHVALLLLTVVLLIPAIYGSINTKVYYNLDRSLPRDLPSIVSNNKLKKDYDMASTHFLLVDKELEGKDVSIMIDEIEELEGVNSVLTFESLVGPTIPKEFLPSELTEIFQKGDHQLIIIQSVNNVATKEVSKEIESITEISKKYDSNSLLTGESVLTKDLTTSADHDFKVVNLLSIVLVLIIVAFVFKSVAIPILLITAIELAILINMAIPFYIDQTIPFVASIIIGTIQLGSTIDYSILLTSRYLEELHQNSDKYAAMQTTVKGTARSIVTSALSFMAATVGVGLYSNMEIVSVICLMMARGALISMLIILLLLPSVLLFFHPFIIRTTKGMKFLYENNN